MVRGYVELAAASAHALTSQLIGGRMCRETLGWLPCLEWAAAFAHALDTRLGSGHMHKGLSVFLVRSLVRAHLQS